MYKYSIKFIDGEVTVIAPDIDIVPGINILPDFVQKSELNLERLNSQIIIDNFKYLEHEKQYSLKTSIAGCESTYYDYLYNIMLIYFNALNKCDSIEKIPKIISIEESKFYSNEEMLSMMTSWETSL